MVINSDRLCIHKNAEWIAECRFILNYAKMNGFRTSLKRTYNTMKVSYLICSFTWICAQLFLFNRPFLTYVDIITHGLERATE
jgi:hypothetical protein